jgi:hypothetical protein
MSHEKTSPFRTPTEVARACLAAHRAQDWETLRTLCHPNARIGVFAGGGRPQEVEDAIAVLREAHSDHLYEARAEEMVKLDDQAVVLEGSVRFRDRYGWAQVERSWLYVVREGLLYRSAVCRSRDEARRKYDALDPTLGLPD